MKIRNPANERVIEEVSADSSQALTEKVTRARAAQPAWAETPLEQRLAAIASFRDRVVAAKDELSLVLTREMGKPITQARNEIAALPGRLDFFLQQAARVLAPEVVHEEKKDDQTSLEEIISQEPLGVVLNISAWNYPWFVGTNVFVPALLTGNSVIYKPSEHATLTGLRIAKLLHESGVPESVFVPAIGGGEVGAQLLDESIDAVFFTGSYRTGKRIAEQVAPRLLKLGLELGGKDPTYVADDADVQSAAEGLADGAMYNTGQSCCSVERIYVHEAVAERFIQAFVKTVSGFVIGDPEDPKTYIGPLAREDQLTELGAQVDDAVRKGARLVLGGRRLERSGYYFDPTVLTEVTSKMRLMREESFGPIIGIQSVRSDAEAIELMNDSEYGLTAGIYTRDRVRALRVLNRVDAGSAYWNCCDRVSPRLPWTGRKHSGIGSTLSSYGIRTFLQPKALHLRVG